MKITIKDKEVSMSDYIYQNMMGLRRLVEKNFDGVVLVDGMEGSGKSELAKQCCLVLDKNFNHNKVVYTVDQFYEAVDKARPGSCILWDEFVFGGLSTEALSKVQTALIKKFTVIRQKQLIIFLVIPYIFLLRKYFAVARTRFLMHVYTKGEKRGLMAFYNYDEKLWLYNWGFKTWTYNPKVIPTFRTTFSNWSGQFLDEDAITAKKMSALDDIGAKDEKNIVPSKKVARIILDMNFSAILERNSSPYRLMQLYKEKLRAYLAES